jgi:hypothetical protein
MRDRNPAFGYHHSAALNYVTEQEQRNEFARTMLASRCV